MSGFSQVSDDASEVNWCLLSVVDKKLEEASAGTGLASLVEAFDEKLVQFACIRITGVDERESVVSKRPKYVQINWVGPKVPAMKRMGALSAKAEVAKLYRGTSGSMDTSDVTELSMNELGLLLLKSGGAHKPTHYDFGAGETVLLDDLKQSS